MMRRLGLGLAILAIPVFVVLLVPGLSGVRARLAQGNPGWVAAGIVLELLSCLSFAALFRPVLGSALSRSDSAHLSLSVLGVNALVPAGGVGGLALSAAVLRRHGVAASRIWRRTIALGMLSSAANATALIAVGILLACGVGGHPPLTLSLLPAAVATAGVLGVLALGRLRVAHSPPGAPRGLTRLLRRPAALIGGSVQETLGLLRSPVVIAGSLGYWAFDNLVLWASFRAFGHSPSLTVLAAAYLIGMIGDLIPLPGGLGGAEQGVLGVLVLFGVSAGAASAATLTYGAIAFATPAVLGLAALPYVERLLALPTGAEAVGDARPRTGVVPALAAAARRAVVANRLRRSALKLEPSQTGR
jgi:uncharacterized membrane protein YbhN (UPF0104 family)